MSSTGRSRLKPRSSTFASHFLIDVAVLSELGGFFFETALDRFFLLHALFGSVTTNIFCDTHAAEMWTAHGTEVRRLCTFLRQSLTKLLPIIFALIGLAVNSSLCRLIPVDAIHHGLE